MGKIVCGYCKAKIEEGSKKCPSCGKEFSYWKKDKKTPTKPENPEKRKAFWWMMSAFPIYFILILISQRMIETSAGYIIYSILSIAAYFYAFLFTLRWLSIKRDLPKQDIKTALTVALIFLLIAAALMVVSIFLNKAFGMPNLATINQENAVAAYKALFSDKGKLIGLIAINVATGLLFMLLVYPLIIKRFYNINYKKALATYILAWLIIRAFTFAAVMIIGFVTVIFGIVKIAQSITALR